MNLNKTNTKSYEMDMCSGPILKKMLLYSAPLMASGVLQLMFNAMDIVVVGKFAGDNSLAAVGSNTSIIGLITNLFIGLSVATNVMIARFFGSKDVKALTRTVHTSMLLSLLSGILLTVIGVGGAKWILELMQTPAEVLPLAVLYLRIYFLGMTATMIYNFGSAILRGIGDTRRPLYFLITAGVINVALNLIFVIIFKMDVAGVALATVISQCVSAYMVTRCLMREKGAIRLHLKALRIDKDKLLTIFRIGLPAGFQGIMFSISNVIIQSSVNSFGPIIMAGNAAAQNLESFVYIAMNAFHQAAVTFTSQNFGAMKWKRINKTVVYAQVCVTAVGLLLGNLVCVFGKPLVGIYTSNPEVVSAGLDRLNIIARTQATAGMMDVMVGALRGVGYSLMPMIVSLIGVCGIRIMWIFTVFRMEQFHTIQNLYISYPLSWFATFLVHLGCFLVIRTKLEKRMKTHGPGM